MNRILYINACAREGSRTSELAQHLLVDLDGHVECVDLYEEDIRPLDAGLLAERDNLLKSGKSDDEFFSLARQFASADTIVIAAPYWDLMFPSVLKVYLENDGLWWMGRPGYRPNNWNPWILSNVLTVFLLTEKNEQKLHRALTKMFTELQVFYDGIPSDGGCDEGPSYWHSAGGALFDALSILHCMSGGKIDIFDSDLVRNIGEYMVHVHINNRYFINFADCGTAITPDAMMIYRYGERCASETLQGFACLLPGSGHGLAPARGRYVLVAARPLRLHISGYCGHRPSFFSQSTAGRKSGT